MNDQEKDGTVDLQDAQIGQDVMLVERMDDGEVRHTHYRRAGHRVRFTQNVAVIRLRVTQGVPGAPPRYDVVTRHRVPSEAHGRTPVMPLEPWS